MKDIKYGQWVITVDVEKTKEYYASYSRPKDRSAQNFELYLGDITAEEKEFFDSFGVDIMSCYVETKCLKLKNEEQWICKGEFPVCVENIVYPYEYSLPIEEVIERYQAGTLDDDQIRIGRFRIVFSCNKRSSVFMPEGFVCFEFFCDDIKWLIDEELEELSYEEERKQHFNEAFERLGIKATPLDIESIEAFREDWVNAYAPPKKNIKKIKRFCEDYLWHIFSFGFLECDEEEIASEKYNKQDKSQCVFLSNLDDIAYLIENVDALTAKILEQFIDVTVTSTDFAWTYVKTHEGNCGPYFYKKETE